MITEQFHVHLRESQDNTTSSRKKAWPQIPSSFSLKLLWGFSSSVIHDGTLRRFYSCPLSKEAILLFFSLRILPLVYFLGVFPCAVTNVCLALC